MIPTPPTSAARIRRRPLATLALGVGTALVLAGAASAQADEARVLEQVSPVAKPNGGQVATRFGTDAEPGWASADGDGVLYLPAALGVASNPSRGGATVTVARRTATGWTNVAAFPDVRADTVYAALSATPKFIRPSEDLTSAFFVSDVPFALDQPASYGQDGTGGAAFLRGRPERNEWLSKPTWPGSVPTPGTIAGGAKYFLPLGGTPDQRSAYFATHIALDPADAAVRPDAGVNGDWSIYHSGPDGIPVPAATLPGGGLDPGGAVPAGVPMSPTAQVRSAVVQDSTNPVSVAGDSLLFVSPDPAGTAADTRNPQLYLARQGRATVRLTGDDGVRGLSGGERSDPPGETRSGIFAYASPDHRYVFFVTEDALTAAAAAPGVPARKAYRYDTTTAQLLYLPPLSGGVQDGRSIVRVSDDGSRVLYAVTPTNQPSQLRLWVDGAVRDLGEATATAARFSRDGRTVVLSADAPLGGEPLHPPGTTQLYRVADGAAATCVTCGTAEHPATAPTLLDPNKEASQVIGAGKSSRIISDDGSRVFFETRSALVADDHNDVLDVYEWHDDAVRLVSGGRADAHSSFMLDNSASGRDVFFATDDRLADADFDGSYDVYDGRLGGGFPKVAPTPECTGDGCQDAPIPPPATPQPTSTTGGPESRGPRDPAPPRSATVRITRSTGSATRVTLRVAVPGRGRVRVTGAGLTATQRTVTRGSTYTLRANLTARSRASLRRHGRLTVTARLRFTPAQGGAVTRTAKLTIKSAKR